MKQGPIPLPPTQVAEWESKWGKETGRLEMVNGAGQQITDSELNAGIGARLLTHTDPLPNPCITIRPQDLTNHPFVNIKIQYSEK
ncbi:MAG TPA: hypothetical protein VLH08_12810 [Acidobacteriota bacterium]|nr:hypothetical protein [Acidobacteriota bacterium]